MTETKTLETMEKEFANNFEQIAVGEKWLVIMGAKREAGTITEQEDSMYCSMQESLGGLKKDLFGLDAEIKKRKGYEFINIGLSPADMEALKKDGVLKKYVVTTTKIKAMEKELAEREATYNEAEKELADLETKIEAKKQAGMTDEELTGDEDFIASWGIETGLSYDARNGSRLFEALKQAKQAHVIDIKEWGLQEVLYA